MIESRNEDGKRYHEQECYRSQYAMCRDQVVVFEEITKAIPHTCAISQLFCSRCAALHRKYCTIVLHSLKIQAHEIRQQECIPIGIPRAVSNMERIGVIRAAAGSSQPIDGHV
jgi:hypothetical protein